MHSFYLSLHKSYYPWRSERKINKNCRWLHKRERNSSVAFRCTFQWAALGNAQTAIHCATMPTQWTIWLPPSPFRYPLFAHSVTFFSMSVSRRAHRWFFVLFTRVLWFCSFVHLLTICTFLLKIEFQVSSKLCCSFSVTFLYLRLWHRGYVPTNGFDFCIINRKFLVNKKSIVIVFKWKRMFFSLGVGR